MTAARTHHRPSQPAKAPRKAPAAAKKAAAKRPSRSTAVQRAAKSGSRLDLLTAVRNRIAADIDKGVAARDLASLSKRLLDIDAEIAELEVAAEVDGVTEAAGLPDEPWSG